MTVLASFTGKFSGAEAVQFKRTGHSEHKGDVGLQITCPNSINAELKSLGSPDASTNASARSQSRFFPSVESIGVASFSNRDKTRATFPSTMGLGRLKAKLAMAPAV
jgi:hypothetical protein